MELEKFDLIFDFSLQTCRRDGGVLNYMSAFSSTPSFFKNEARILFQIV